MVKKRILLMIVLILLGGIGYYFLTSQKGETQKHPATIATIKRGDIEQVITSQGKLEPKEYVDVGAQVSGQLQKLHVGLGDNIKKDDLIAEIDPKLYQAKVAGDEARLKTLRAQLTEQEAQIKLAKLISERNDRLLKVKAVSKQVTETTGTDLEVAKARAVSLQAQIEEAESTLAGDKANLDYAKIYAPINGTVVVLTSREGQTLNANQVAPVIVQLANLDTMTARAQVAEADVLNLKENMDVYFTILGNLQRKWHGKIRQILPSPEIVNEVVLYNVLVDVDNTDRQLMNGMTTQMFFVEGSVKNVPLIPVAALVKPVPGQAHAYIVRVPDGKKQTEKPVQIGLMNRTMAEVKSGLSENDKVLVQAPVTDTAAGAGSGGGRFMGGPRL